MRGLQAYRWPGNVRELENEMKRLAVSARHDVIVVEDLSVEIQTANDHDTAGEPNPARPLNEAVADLEKRMIAEALRTCHQNQQQAARMLGVSRQGLIKKMKRYGVKVKL